MLIPLYCDYGIRCVKAISYFLLLVCFGIRMVSSWFCLLASVLAITQLASLGSCGVYEVCSNQYISPTCIISLSQVHLHNIMHKIHCIDFICTLFAKWRSVFQCYVDPSYAKCFESTLWGKLY